MKDRTVYLPGSTAFTSFNDQTPLKVGILNVYQD